ncbi:MAG TPA: hypothetical protein VK400_03605 [Pyrinomonadaceae bacterium]|nr:hypothetical protein [Pyrinomonadaceae bacterium]
MAVSKKVKKIVAEFFALFDRCEKVSESKDFKEKIKTRREFCEYVSKHRKVLGISDEKVKELEAGLAALEKSDANVKRLEARLAEARRAARQSEQKYYDALLVEPPTGKKRISH